MSTRDDGLQAAPDSASGLFRPLLGLAALLLTGGILLDMNRINSVRDTLNRVAEVAAIEAAAAPLAVDRDRICRRRFNKHVWTDTEVSIDDVAVSLAESREGRYATVEYDATVKLVVGRFFGWSEVSISGEAEVPAPTKQAVASIP